MLQELSIRKEDQMLMSLVHYFVTKENYAPIYVQGVKDEIWLEKLDGPYRVIRINSNHIFNDEQYKFDQFKIKNILQQVKKRTFSFTINALNINLNEEGEDRITEFKNIDCIKLSDIDEVQENPVLLDVFPNIKDSLVKDTSGLDLIFNVTKDINAKTERDNIKYSKIFAPKKIIVTYVLMALMIIGFLLQHIVGYNTTLMLFANNRTFLKMGQLYRLFTNTFMHGDILHLFCNVYSFLIIGKEVEAKFGKWRFLVIFFLSSITGGLLSGIFTTNFSLGASDAIFGLMGALVYFGYKYRLYLRDSLLQRIVPVIVLNLLIGASFTMIDNWAHVGGLIGGYLATMMVGISVDDKKSDRINGAILYAVFTLFLAYMLFFR